MPCLFGPQKHVLVLSIDKPVQLGTTSTFKVLKIYSFNISDNSSGRFLRSNNFTCISFSELKHLTSYGTICISQWFDEYIMILK